MSTSIRKKILDYLYLIAVALIAYWPVSAMQFSLKNDALNYFLPVRYNISEAIQNGIFPGWSPYINMGYPIHGDVQSGVWNPVVIIMSLIRKYDIYWLQVETVIAILIAGISMYHLLKYLKLNRTVILLVSASYMLNGYITDSGQFINWIYSASFLPFVIQSTLQAFSTFSLKHSFKLGVSLTLMLVTGYPADFILLFYTLFAFILCAFCFTQKEYKFKTKASLYTKQILFSSITFLILSLPAYTSYIPFFQMVNRGKGVSLDSALTDSLSPINLISLVTPWPTLKASWYQLTDPLIRNCYSGFILFIFFIHRILYKKNKSYFEKFWITSIIFFLLFSLGEYGGLRVFSYYFLPLMDTFRHPANAKLFFIFGIQLLAAYSINDYLNANNFDIKQLKKLFLTSLFIVSSLSIYSLVQCTKTNSLLSGIHLIENINTSIIKQIKDSLTFFDLLFLNSLFLLFFLLFVYFQLRMDGLKKYLIFLSLIEMFIITQGMLPQTYVRNLHPKKIETLINEQPKGYPIPDNHLSLTQLSTDGYKYFDTIGPLNPYNKKPGRIDYVITPSNLATHDQFWKHKKIREKIFQYSLCYFADTVFNIKDTSSFISYNSNKKAAILNKDSDTVVSNTASDKKYISIDKFLPGEIKITTHTPEKSLLVLQQNFYKGWKVFINGKAGKIEISNISFMSTYIPAGNNSILFVYKKQNNIFFILASIVFFLTSLLVLRKKYKISKLY